MLTRGYRVVRPPWGRRPRRHSAAKSRERRRPAACRCGTAVPIPHLYRHPTMLPAPQGSHYSITAGERSEPAEGAYLHHHRPQGGRTPYVGVLRRHPSGGSSPPACCRGWLCRAYVRSTPLGPYIYMWLSFRGFAALTRGYRVVRPPWGRRPRRHSAAKSLERRRPRRHPRSMSLWYRCPRAYVGATHPAKLSSPSPSPQHAVVVSLSSCHICTGIPRSCRPRRGRTTL